MTRAAEASSLSESLGLGLQNTKALLVQLTPSAILVWAL